MSRKKLFEWLAFLAMVCGFAAVGVYSMNIPPPKATDQERAAQEIQRASLQAQRAADTAARERVGFLCRQRSICGRYAEARQACAVAGNYNQCMSIKMGADLSLIGDCTSAGEVIFSDTPGAGRCLLYDLLGQ